MFGASFFGKKYFDGDYWSPVTGEQQVINTGGGDIYTKSSILAAQIEREDEEIIAVVITFMGMMK